MPEISARIQYFHLRKPVTVRDLKRLAYQRDRVDARGFKPFEEPYDKTAQIVEEHIPGAILRIPGQHPVDTRWSCADPEFAFSLPLRDADAWGQLEMRAADDDRIAHIREVDHVDA